MDNPRWAGVPFLLTAGKALSEKLVEVRVVFRRVAGGVREVAGAAPNELVIRVQPDECIYWRVQNRVPGLLAERDLKIERRRMNLMYSPLETSNMPDAYERLLLEVVRGDATNFVSVEELDAAWAVFSPALSALAAAGEKPLRYDAGSAGPDTAKLRPDPDGLSFDNAPAPPAEPTSPRRGSDR